MSPTKFRVVGQRVWRVDGVKLVCGEPVFTDDVRLPGMLHAGILKSPHAHAIIREIDVSKARALPGVHAVLTYKDVPRVPHTTAGQQPPEPSPYDAYLLDRKVRHVGDRVAFVAAETPELVEEALGLIYVDYEVLPAVFDPIEASKPGAPVIHDEPESRGIYDPSRNHVYHVEMEIGDVENGFAEADLVYEQEYRVPQVSQAPNEPHVAIAYLDEQNRLVIRTSTQVPFHTRRILSQELQIPAGMIRVIKPRIGGGFGAKQEMVIEDVAAILCLTTGRPVRLFYSREEEFTSARSRHPMVIRLKTGVKKDGTLVAREMKVIANAGAYGTHSCTVPMVTGLQNLSLYRCPNMRFVADSFYTNLPPTGAYRGYGTPQGAFAQEVHMDELAHMLGIDPVEFRRKNHIREGDREPVSEHLSEGTAVVKYINSCGLPQCIDRVLEELKYYEKRGNPGDGTVKRGVGIAIATHGTSIPGADMGGATCKANEDGTFNVFVGATDLGTGSDTVIAQMVAEVLGVSVDKIIIYSSDTDVTPFDVGAYASSTTHVSGMAAKLAAEKVRDELFAEAADMLEVSPEDLEASDGRIYVRGSPDRGVSIADVSYRAMYGPNKRQVFGAASYTSGESPPPYACQGAEVLVDTETGEVRVLRIVSAVDCGVAINPALAEGQIEGGVLQGVGYGLFEEFVYDRGGRLLTTNFTDYRVATAKDAPEIKAILVETYEPTTAFGNKSVAEIPIDIPAPAIVNAVHDAIGAWLREIPITPERVLKAIKESGR